MYRNAKNAPKIKTGLRNEVGGKDIQAANNRYPTLAPFNGESFML
jgi:hypothetical protein